MKRLAACLFVSIMLLALCYANAALAAGAEDIRSEQDRELTRQSGAGFSSAARSGGEGALEVRRADSDTAAGEKTSRDVAGIAGLTLNTRLKFTAGAAEETREYTFTPATNNVFCFESFGGTAVGELSLAGQSAPVLREEGFQIRARLIAGETYTLKVTTSAQEAGRDIAVEVMRDAYGRCFSRPIPYRGGDEGYSKVIAREYDTHWYSFTAETSGPYTIKTESEMDTVGYLLDLNGDELAYSDGLAGAERGDFCIRAELTAGLTYCLRVSAQGDEIGPYHLKIVSPREGELPPESVRLNASEMTLTLGGAAALTAEVLPENAHRDIVYLSLDPLVASVDASGLVRGLSAGQTTVYAIAYGDVRGECRVTVEIVPLTEMRFVEESLTLPAGQSAPLRLRTAPENATTEDIVYTVADPAVASVTEDGLLTALSPGETAVTASWQGGTLQSDLALTVLDPLPVYRALLLGEQGYLDGRSRRGGINTTQGMADMLRETRFGEARYEITMKLDSTRTEAIESIRETFAAAVETDVSLFYVNCHGDYKNGVAYLEFHDGKRLTAQQLERELRKVKGRVVLLIDCCQSGGFLDGFAAPFHLSKYLVMTSTGVGMDSYRIDSEGLNNESTMATVFARSLCEGAGWDLIKDKTVSMKADLDKDRVITFWEAFQYTRARVRRYLKSTGAVQEVRSGGGGESFPLFMR